MQLSKNGDPVYCFNDPAEFEELAAGRREGRLWLEHVGSLRCPIGESIDAIVSFRMLSCLIGCLSRTASSSE
jgi:hypothetical protein